MKLFNALITSSLIMLGSQVAWAEQNQVEQYSYGSKLDIAKVIYRDVAPDVCGVVPVKMTYLDHQGQQHIVQYLANGNNCFEH